MDLYIYYRASVADADFVTRQVLEIQAELTVQHTVKAALKRRPDARDGLHTWMEVYAAVPAGFEASLSRVVTDAGLDRCIVGVRHAEYFQDISPCA